MKKNLKFSNRFHFNFTTFIAQEFDEEKYKKELERKLEDKIGDYKKELSEKLEI